MITVAVLYFKNFPIDLDLKWGDLSGGIKA